MRKFVMACVMCVASMGASAQNVLDYSWAVVSANKIEDVNYTELEGGFGKGNFGFYGFYDLNDDGSTFSKVNASYTLGKGIFIEATQKEFSVDNMAFQDTFYGIGYMHSFDKGGFLKASINTRDEGGSGILMAGSYPFIFDTTLDGWADFVDKDGDRDFRGNIGVRKFVSDNIYLRVAAHWQHLEGSSMDTQAHFQLGYQI